LLRFEPELYFIPKEGEGKRRDKERKGKGGEKRERRGGVGSTRFGGKLTWVRK